jgi:hypothetical protein
VSIMFSLCLPRFPFSCSLAVCLIWLHGLCGQGVGKNNPDYSPDCRAPATRRGGWDHPFCENVSHFVPHFCAAKLGAGVSSVGVVSGGHLPRSKQGRDFG